MESKKANKGFTLIELIVVIAIIAILVTIVVLAINPSEQLARSRDSKRVADLDTMRAAFNLYLAQATGTASLAATSTTAGQENSNCKGGSSPTIMGTNGTAGGGVGTIATSAAMTIIATSVTQTIGTLGWARAGLDKTPGGTPVSNLPLDPTNSSIYFYLYGCDSADKTYEFTARLESTFFANDQDLDGKDGGDNATAYEVGSKLTILPATD